MAKKYIDKDVLSAAFERLEYIFDVADNVLFSVSGGKDSSVMMQLANMVAKKKKYDVLYIDFETQYKATIDHIYELKKLSNLRTFYHICLPMYLRNAVSVLQPKWICWNEDDMDIWVRKMPKDAINEHNHPFDFWNKPMEFEEFVPLFQDWYIRTHGGLCFVGVGIRSDESLNRFRTVSGMLDKETYKDKNWTTKQQESLYSFFPLYDWRTEDIWGAVSKFNLKFNKIYELMYKNGVSIHEQRLCQPYGDDQRNGLDQFKALEYETWEKVLNRVNGVNFGNIYCKTSALGNLKTSKPDFMTWEEYSIYLLESIGLYNKELELHYYEKIKKFMKWYKEKENIDITDIPEEADRKLESMKKVISWRRIARSIEKNDFYMSRLSFGQTKSDAEKLEKMISKWDNILNETTETTSKDLRRMRDKYVKRNKDESTRS